jgi:hypothetical protein
MSDATPAWLGLSSISGKARFYVAERLAACLQDRRAPERIRHSVAEMLRIRLLMVAAGMRMATMLIPCAMTPRSSLPIGARLSAVSTYGTELAI